MSPSYPFATLTPSNTEAVQNFKAWATKTQQNPANYKHHVKFLRVGDFSRDVETPSAMAEDNGSESRSTERNSTNGPPSNFPGCYEFSLSDDRRPLHPPKGWIMGVGNWEDDSGGVDLVVNFHPAVYSRHMMFHFGEHGRFMLTFRHGGVEFDGEEQRLQTSRPLAQVHFIRIGPLSYCLRYSVPAEMQTDHQLKIRHLLKAFQGIQQPPDELLSATPSGNDLRIGDWIIRGVAGHSARTVVEAASNNRTGEVVAVKRMWRWNKDSERNVAREIKLYRDLKSVIKEHKHSLFVMLMHSVIYKTQEVWQDSPDEVFLFFTPLGSTTFHSVRQWTSIDHKTKLDLFCQICLGLDAIHDMQWIHRDIKPPNLYVVTFDPPYAVVGDFDNAIRSKGSNLKPQRAHCGTIGWLAPELENDQIVPQYNCAVDIWSLGAVGWHLFNNGARPPWVSNQPHNVFVNQGDPAFNDYRKLVQKLSYYKPESLEHLIGQMLSYKPHDRQSMFFVLKHPALYSTVCAQKH
ncbi:MAG: hypothetical protein LQ348_005621 [Seirophora lacunosa]|nr:MAG: hypothetical protein LQ348_005621 [Seirophora lacunosa]